MKIHEEGLAFDPKKNNVRAKTQKSIIKQE